MQTILIGTDGHESSFDALSFGGALARTTGSRLIVAAAIEHAPFGMDAGPGDDARLGHFDRIFARVEDHLGELPYQRFELDDEAPRALIELAERESAELIVIGHTHRGVLSRLVSTTTGDQLLEGAPCAVAVAPRDYAGREHDGFGIIGVGYDGGAESRLALVFAEELAAGLGCDLLLITAAPDYEGVPDPLGSTRDTLYEERMLAGVRGVTRASAEGKLEHGDTAKVLATRGVELDMLVVGSRSHGRALRTLLGSVASELIRTAPCPVIVTPRAATREEAVG